MRLCTRACLLALAATAVSAQYGPGGHYGPDSNDDDNDNGYPYSPGSSSNGQYGYSTQSMDSRRRLIIAHGVLASLAFVLFFPVGAILIRLGSFRGIWLIHGIFQIFAYLVYVAAFGIGVWMVNNIPVDLLNNYHPVIGILVFVLLFFQPILGCVHHLAFKKYNRRTVWSYAHLWLGRVVITLGMINGGLGLLLASDAPAFTGFAPSRGQIIAYGVVAGVMWILWVVAAIYGERKRKTSSTALADKEVEVQEGTGTPPPYKEIYA